MLGRCLSFRQCVWFKVQMEEKNPWPMQTDSHQPLCIKDTWAEGRVRLGDWTWED